MKEIRGSASARWVAVFEESDYDFTITTDGSAILYLKMAIKNFFYSVNILNLFNNFKLFCLIFIHQMVIFKSH
jgi:hypothetical protein